MKIYLIFYIVLFRTKSSLFEKPIKNIQKKNKKNKKRIKSNVIHKIIKIVPTVRKNLLELILFLFSEMSHNFIKHHDYIM